MDKPLTGRARLALIAGAGMAIVAFYLFTVIAVLLLLVIVAVEFILVIVLIRLGLAGVMGRIMGRHLAVLATILRSCWLGKGTEFRIPLSPEEAPGLFSLVDNLCWRLQLTRPEVVSLEMSVNAWVRLGGFRQGAGRTILGLGYDLLAGLSEAEVEAVLAHEMAHAKLIRRGFRRWLSAGLARCATLANALSAQAEACRRARQISNLAGVLLEVADPLTRHCARLVASYSRQDEFDADRGAAELCGTANLRSALLKLEALAGIAARLPLRDRVAQLQLEEGFSRWLVKELAAGSEKTGATREHEAEVHDRYSTHPRLVDRLAALPAEAAKTPREQRPAVLLLADADAIADRLVREIERVLAEQEQKDNQELKRLLRRVRASVVIRPLQWLGICGLVAGGFGVLVAGRMFMDSELNLPWVIGTVVALGGGIALFRRGRYRDRRVLPVPDFALLKERWQEGPASGDLQAAQKAIEAELRPRLAAEKGRRRRVDLMVAESYAALGQAQYLRAHVAARLGLEVDRNSVEGRLGLGIAAAALLQAQQAQQALHAVQRATGLRSAATAWGGAWALLYLGNWVLAEALLDQAVKQRPEETTLLTLLALAQSRRGKLQSAVRNAREACTPQPKNREHAKLLIELLLNTGQVREVQERLRGLEADAKDDPELMLLLVRLHLLRHDVPEAGRWTELLTRGSVRAQTLVQLGVAHETARLADSAAAFYHQALSLEYYPEAFLGLARLASSCHDREEARRLALAALDLTRPVGRGASGPLPILPQILGQLLLLEEPRMGCRAWVAQFGPAASPTALANQALLIYATGRPEAESALTAVLGAMQPGVPPVATSTLQWREAPRRQQPDRPVRPGVQGVIH